jgi:fructose-bisphosphate aldolase, class I
MRASRLANTARALVAPSRGILAAYESTATITKRLQAHAIPSTEWTRRDWRELLITAPGVEQWISGVILHDETVRQLTSEGTTFCEALEARGMIPGVKVDTGTRPMPGSEHEKVTDGLGGLQERLTKYASLGARFAKWRAVLEIGEGLPTGACLAENAQRLARYAAHCQLEGLVPIVEPEVLMAGKHPITRCQEVTETTLRVTFAALAEHQVDLAGVLLKPNMVLAGATHAHRVAPEDVAEATLQCLCTAVPSELAGVVFLSGGQSSEEATENLRAINARGKQRWELSFSFGRGLQQDALAIWGGDVEHTSAAQAAFLQRARANGAARQPAEQGAAA